MKIGSILPYKFLKPQMASLKPSFSNCITNPYPNDTFERKTAPIVFSGVSTQDFKIKDIKNLRCPVCGLIMLDNDQVDAYVSEVAPKRGVELVRSLQKYEDDIIYTGIKLKQPKSIYRPQKQEVINIIKRLALEYPDKSLAELVQFEAQNHIVNLILTQLEIIAELENYIKKADIDYGEKTSITYTINEYKKQVRGEVDIEFHRKEFIGALSNLTKNQKVQYDILKIANQMPASDTEIDAFFVKYSKQNRTSREIAKKFVNQSLASAEHLTPKDDQGQDNLRNYICDCAECNAKRAKTPFYEWQKTIPNFKENLQEYLNEVQRALERKELDASYNDYIDNIVNTISKLSYGEIFLQRPESANNRQKRNLTKRHMEINKRLKDLKRMAIKRKDIRNEINSILTNPNYKNVQQYVNTMLEFANLRAQLHSLKSENASSVEISAIEFAMQRHKDNLSFLSNLVGAPPDINRTLSNLLTKITKIEELKNLINANQKSITKEDTLNARKIMLIKRNQILEENNAILIRSYGVDPENTDDWEKYQHFVALDELADKMLNKPSASRKKAGGKNQKLSEKGAARLALQELKSSEKELIKIAKQAVRENIAQLENKETIEYAKQLEEIDSNNKIIADITDEISEIYRKKQLVKQWDEQIKELCGTNTYEKIKQEYERLLELKALIEKVELLPKKQNDMQKLDELISYRKGILSQLDKNYMTLSPEEYDGLISLVDATPEEN